MTSQSLKKRFVILFLSAGLIAGFSMTAVARDREDDRGRGGADRWRHGEEHRRQNWDRRDREDRHHHEENRGFRNEFRYEARDRSWSPRRYEQEHSRAPMMSFNDHDRRFIRDYYHRDYRPRHHWRGVPPEWAYYMRPHACLPFGLRVYLEPFPYAMERHLVPLPTNHFRFFFAGKGLIVDAQYNVLDVFDVD